MFGDPIDVTAKLEVLIRDIGNRVARLRHVRDAKVACLVRIPKPNTRCGVWATVFSRTRSRHPWDAARTTPFMVDGGAVDYVIVFDERLFLRDPPELRLWTLFHELWHLHPSADGRRRPLRHGHRFDAAVANCVSTYRASAPPEQYAWLLELRPGMILTARVAARGRWPRRHMWTTAWDTIVRELGRSPCLVGRLADPVPTQRATMRLDAVRVTPRYTYRCTEGHEVHTWGKFRIVRACGRCHRECGVLTPLVLSAPAAVGNP
jgi:hypothetical protein